MNDRLQEQYRAAMDGVHAPATLEQRVQELNQTSRRKPTAWVRKAVSGAVAAVLVIAFTNVAAYAATGSTWMEGLVQTILYFHGSEGERQTALQSETANLDLSSQWVTEDDETESIDWSTPEGVTALQQMVADRLASEDAAYTYLLDETGSAADGWLRQVIRVTSDNLYDHYEQSYLGDAAADLASLLPWGGDWSLSWLEEHYNAVPACSYLSLHYTDSMDEPITAAYLTGYYVSEDGGLLQLWCAYDGSGEMWADHVNSEELDFHSAYTTADGVTLAFLGRDEQILGELSLEGMTLYLFGSNLTLEDMKNVADHINLSTLSDGYANYLAELADQ
ncbi:MAG: hypothetical protein LUC87_04170 [Clostridiales bacterium]|nr:hypothetical protein [Clostridiales bacterium]